MRDPSSKALHLFFALCIAVAIACGDDPGDTAAKPAPRPTSPAAEVESPRLEAGDHRIAITSRTVRIDANRAELGAVLDELGRRMGIDVEAAPSVLSSRVEVAAESDRLAGVLPSLLSGLDYGVSTAYVDGPDSATRVVRITVGQGLSIAGASAGAASARTRAGSLDEYDEEGEDEDEDEYDASDVLDELYEWDDDVEDAYTRMSLADRLSLMERGSREERINAIRATDPDGPGLQAMVRVVERDGDPLVRTAAAAQLEDTADFAGVRALIVALSDSDVRVVRAAIESLEFAGDETVVRHLEPLLSHPNEGVRDDAAEAIEFLRD